MRKGRGDFGPRRSSGPSRDRSKGSMRTKRRGKAVAAPERNPDDVVEEEGLKKKVPVGKHLIPIVREKVMC